MEKERNTPSIRFKGFTAPWEQCKLSEIADVYDGVHQTPDYQEAGIMFLSVENIATLTSNKFISEEAFERDYKNYPEKGDILMTRIGDVGTPNVVETTDKVAFYVSLALLKPKKADSYFLCNTIQSPGFQKELHNRTLVTAVPQKINKAEIGEVKFMAPEDSAEQKIIGKYFQNIERLISLHQRKLDREKRLKEYLLQNMFPRDGENVPLIRFPGFTGLWKTCKLGDLLVDLYNGQTPSRFHPEFWNGNIHWLSSGELNHGIVTDTLETITVEGQANAHLRVVPQGTFVMAITGLEAAGTRGNCAILGLDTTLNQSCMALFPNKEKLTSRFLFYWYHLIGETYGIKYTQGTKQQSYNAEIIKDLKIVLPEVKEQEMVSSLFFNLDSLITLHQRKLESLKALKKGFLQRMFV